MGRDCGGHRLKLICLFVHLDDQEFELVIFKLNQGLIDFDTDCLETLYFNPLNSKNSTAQTFDIDPDQQLFTRVQSNYYVPDQFNEISMQYNPSLSLLHINARSLIQNQPKLVELLNTIDLSISVIEITETWPKNLILKALIFSLKAIILFIRAEKIRLEEVLVSL